MTLYSKWTLVQNIIFILAIIMVICLFRSWISMSEMQKLGLGVIYNLFDQWKEFKYLYDGDTLKKLEQASCAYKFNELRFLIFAPLLYTVYCLFREKYNKNLCCISALLMVIVSITFLMIGKNYCSFDAWIFTIISMVYFLVNTVPSSKTIGYKD